MRLTLDAYHKITAYLTKFYNIPLYTYHDLRHPLLFYPANAGQREQVDSVLGQMPKTTLTRDDFYSYDYGYLHSLQNGKSHLYNGTTFTMKRIRPNPVRIDGSFGRYFDMLATCHAMEQELRDSSGSKLIRLPLRSQFHRQISPKQCLTDGRGRSATIGGVALIVFNDGGHYQGIVAHRTTAHATHPDSYHLLPAFIFQPMAETLREGEWSIEHHFYREWLEELFGMAESDTMDFYQHPALLDLQHMQANGQAGLYLTGIAFSLLSLRPEICMLLLIHDANWWKRVNEPQSPIKLRPSETRDTLILAPISTDDDLLNALPDQTVTTNFVPQAIPALWEGVKLARELIKNL